MKLETREFQLLEPLALRTDEATKRTWVKGLAAVFNRPSADMGGFTEVISPGAFTVSLATPDTAPGGDFRCLFNHDPAQILGRTRNQTLTLLEDSAGLRFESMIPDTTYGRDLLELLSLGTIRGCSFGFYVPEDGDEIICTGNGQIIRTLNTICLAEVSITHSPAYDGTSISLRVDPSILERVTTVRSRPDLAARWLQLRHSQLANA